MATAKERTTAYTKAVLTQHEACCGEEEKRYNFCMSQVNSYLAITNPVLDADTATQIQNLAVTAASGSIDKALLRMAEVLKLNSPPKPLTFEEWEPGMDPEDEPLTVGAVLFNLSGKRVKLVSNMLG